MSDDTGDGPAQEHERHLDGNAVAGALGDWFGADMSAEPSECAHCGKVAEFATLIAFVDAPGLVLRCSSCKGVIIRVADTPHGSYLDARGAAWIRRPPRVESPGDG
jgi:hypothetical protein